MNQKEKNKKIFFTKRRIVFSLMFLCFAISISGIFSKVGHAADKNINVAEIESYCKDSWSSNKICQKVIGITPITYKKSSSGYEVCYSLTIESSSSEDCGNYDKSGNLINSQSVDSNLVNTTTTNYNSEGKEISREKKSTASVAAETATNEVGGWFHRIINWVLYAIFKFVVLVLYIAAKLFDLMVEVKIFSAMMSLPAIEAGWKMVRDIFNIFFILVLLFSAFCTIFQVEKFNVKKILLTLVIMALLVNFSFPISRVIIDTANVPMYYYFKVIANSAKGITISESILNQSGGQGGIQALLLPGVESAEQVKGTWVMTFQIVSSMVFVFIFAITLLVIGVLLLIRIVVLAILVIFSPIGFVGAILPSFSKYANDWWESLFKQSFFGPIMAFMMYIAIFMMSGIQNNINGMLKQAAEDSVANAKTGALTEFQTIMVAGLSLSIPIILLWAAIISAQKMGAAGADSVAKKASGFAKWAGRLPWRGVKAGFQATGIPGGTKQAWEHYKKKGFPGLKKIPGFRGSEATEALENKMGGLLKEGRKGWTKEARNTEQKRVNERVKNLEDTNASASEVEKDLGSDDQIKRESAAKYLTKKGAFGNADRLAAMLKASEGDDDLRKEILNKLPKEVTDGLVKDHDDLKKITDSLGGDKESVKSIVEKIKKDDNTKVLIDYEINHGEIDKDGNVSTVTIPVDVAYKKRLSGLSADNLAKQKGLDASDVNFQSYIINEIAPDKAYHSRVYSKLSRDKRAEWQANRINP